MKVISFSSIKGGTGKSSLAILTANYGLGDIIWAYHWQGHKGGERQWDF